MRKAPSLSPARRQLNSWFVHQGSEAGGADSAGGEEGGAGDPEGKEEAGDLLALPHRDWSVFCQCGKRAPGSL